jgi:uncharacterized protein YfiM (DUF2279 family)
VRFTLVVVFGGVQLVAPLSREPGEDRWFGRDKLYHIAASAVIQGAGHGLFRAAGSDFREASRAAGMLTLFVGVGKEVSDRAAGGAFSWRDLVADAVGGGAGAVVARQVDR